MARLKCHKCGHVWTDDGGDSAPVVQCPECMVLVPLVLAKQGGGGAPEPPAPKRPPAPARDASFGQETKIDRSDLRATIHGYGESTHDARTHMGRADSNPGRFNAPTQIPQPPPSSSTRHDRRSDHSFHIDAPQTFHQGATIPGSSAGPAHPPAKPAGRDSISDLFEADSSPPPPQPPGAAPWSASAHEMQTLGSNAPARGGRGATGGSWSDAETMAGSRPGGASSAPSAGPSRPSAAREKFAQASAKEVDLSGEVIGGYVVKKMLGAGGMGAVCLARQVSLDRDVALKILPGAMARHPELLMRFTREALSAAQLTHHNIIQVYDVGSAENIHYISMEFVRGSNLAEMVREDGRLTPEDAAGYILQAARGLKFAHDRGIIHRDIKPDNLMVNDQGIVKIADMGLAKMRGEIEGSRAATIGMSSSSVSGTSSTVGATPTRGASGDLLRADLTMHDVAMGTPAYMPPEQARDASSVNHLADQYSLGCTLYYLIAGKPPYSGTTIQEILSKHQSEPPPPLEIHVKNVPHAIGLIIRKMMEKNPDDRYLDMSDVIRALEGYLGVDSEKGPYTPREQHAAMLEKALKDFYAAPAAKLRSLAIKGFFLAMPVLIVLAFLVKETWLGRGLLGVLFLTPLANFLVDGVRNKTYLFRRVRSVFFGMSLKGWLATIVGGALSLFLLYAFGLLLWWVAFALVAAGLAALYQFKVGKPLRSQREKPLADAADMLKQLRLRGVSEDALHEFFYRYSGAHWEEFFDSIFGYEPMIYARVRWAAQEQVAPRKRFAIWRDPIARALTDIEEARKKARERRQLAKVEAERLKAEGVSEAEAKKKADELAGKAAEMGFLEVAEADTIATQIRAGGLKPTRPAYRKGFINFVFQTIRFALGAAIVGAWALREFQGVQVPLVPDAILNLLYDYWGLGVGVALIVSAGSSRWILQGITLAGAAVYFGGGFMLPMIEPYFAHELLTVENCRWAAAGLMSIGLGFSALLKFAGGRF